LRKASYCCSLKDEARNADELVQATETQAQPLYRMICALVSVDIFAEDDIGRFRMAPLAKPYSVKRPIACENPAD
jgi:hypothetical protein